VPWFPAELEPLLAVAAAALDESGALIEANAGFLRVASLHGRMPAGADVARCFIQPDFTTLVHSTASPDGDLHSGLLTIGDPMGLTQTLRGRVWRKDGKLCVLAEFDVEELGRLNTTVLELNREYADAQLALAQTNLRLRQREAEIVAISLTDPLTGVGNRRRLEQEMSRELNRAERTGDKLCALMADIDHFKRVNDDYGHEVGDKVLTALAGRLSKHSRATDVVARSGGEEFVVLMPGTELKNATLVAERLRSSLASSLIEPLTESVTVSIGVAEWASGEGAETFLQRADRALYEAKRRGRNRVISG
jgi:two-component system cell cycle response regulator